MSAAAARAAPRAADPHKWRQALTMVAKATRLPLRAVAEPRGLEPKRARALAAYVAHTSFSVPVVHIAGTVGKHRQHVQRWISGVEMRRDDAGFDRLVQTIEERLHAA